jgi:tRNA-specific 2-thiouridylase
MIFLHFNMVVPRPYRHYNAPMEYAVLVSGGVDSAVALHSLAADPNHSIRAYYLKIWLEDELSFLGQCPWEDDLHHARQVCASAGVPLEVVPMQEQYYERVVSYTLAELRAGHTPSPDIFCNQRIKFGAFYDVVGRSADRIASGHYARVVRDGSHARLATAPDPVKDQTYFLSHLTQEQLNRAEFPIGDMTKAEVRSRAQELQLSNRNRPDSQGICFLGRIKYVDFVRHYLGERKGPIVDAESGSILGEHTGSWFYTIGQRQGLGLGNGPWYVVGRDIDTNVITVSHALHVANRARDHLVAGPMHWIAGVPEAGLDPRRDPFDGDGAFKTSDGAIGGLTAKLRHGPQRIPCAVRPEKHGGSLDVLHVQLAEADRGVAPGQFVVLYDEEICLGSGMIEVPMELRHAVA